MRMQNIRRKENNSIPHSHLLFHRPFLYTIIFFLCLRYALAYERACMYAQLQRVNHKRFYTLVEKTEFRIS